MRGQHWITKLGDVLYECAPGTEGRIFCRRVGSDAYVGSRLLAKLRPATPHEVHKARLAYARRHP